MFNNAIGKNFKPNNRKIITIIFLLQFLYKSNLGSRVVISVSNNSGGNMSSQFSGIDQPGIGIKVFLRFLFSTTCCRVKPGCDPIAIVILQCFLTGLVIVDV